jgi:hypothetical protein
VQFWARRKIVVDERFDELPHKIDPAPKLEGLLCKIRPISRKFTSPVRKDVLGARTYAGGGMAKLGWEGLLVPALKACCHSP